MTTCGAWQRIPYVRTALEIQQMRFWKSVPKENSKLQDPVKRAKNQTARYINHQLECLSSVTRKIAASFPALGAVHPFEREVAVLTLGESAYQANIQLLRKVYAKCHNIGKEFAKKLHESKTKQDATDLGILCMDELKKVVEREDGTLDGVASMAKILRALPSIDLNNPIFAFAGAPNVGKSSLVRALSTASPEVANYSFTTRGITLGHIFVNGLSYQIADTPGLLYRPDAKRNKIERLALAMIEKTKANVGFVIDISEHSGFTLAHQLQLRDEIRERFIEKRAKDKYQWIDILSKADLVAQERIDSAIHHLQGQDSIIVSTETNMRLTELSRKISSAVMDAGAELQS